VIPHSHPVLTLSDRYGGDDDFLLTAYLHEQLHWWSMGCPGAQDGRRPAPVQPPLRMGSTRWVSEAVGIDVASNV
jgi:hypothetical protein